jgi:LmbE family N-acetylglucosaminyl deacetylase
VLVVTICTAIPTDGSFSSLAQEFHGQWGLAHDDAVKERLHEDILAMECLGVDSFWVGMLDAIYRRPDAYNNRTNLYEEPVPDDPLAPALAQLIGALRVRIPGATFYAPLGVGGHVDHRLTFKAALLGQGEMATAFYEDFPYSLDSGAVERRLQELGGGFVPSTIDIDPVLSRKIRAISAYASQLDELFGGTEAMRQLVTGYAETLRPEEGTYGERLWLRAPSDAAMRDT